MCRPRPTPTRICNYVVLGVVVGVVSGQETATTRGPTSSSPSGWRAASRASTRPPRPIRRRVTATSSGSRWPSTSRIRPAWSRPATRFSTAEDMARFVAALANGGLHEGVDVTATAGGATGASGYGTDWQPLGAGQGRGHRQPERLHAHLERRPPRDAEPPSRRRRADERQSDAARRGRRCGGDRLRRAPPCLRRRPDHERAVRAVVHPRGRRAPAWGSSRCSSSISPAPARGAVASRPRGIAGSSSGGRSRRTVCSRSSSSSACPPRSARPDPARRCHRAGGWEFLLWTLPDVAGFLLVLSFAALAVGAAKLVAGRAASSPIATGPRLGDQPAS